MISEAVLGGSELLPMEVCKQRLTAFRDAMEDATPALAGEAKPEGA